jgi:4-hydroxythreonine-4-phosphate dehydrogenase
MESASFIPRLVIPVGDPAGIGPEVVLKAIADSPISSSCQITLIGTRTLLEKAYHDPHLLRSLFSDRFALQSRKNRLRAWGCP